MEVSRKKPDVLSVIDEHKSTLVKTNRVFLNSLGYSDSEISTLNIKDLISEENYEAYKEVLEVTLSSGTANTELSIRKNNQDYVDVYLNTILFEYEGETWIQCVFIDITEPKNIQEELNETNQFLDSIIENIPDMVFLKDAEELRFLRFNKAGEELLGYSRDDLIGKNDYDFFPKEQADFFTAKDKATLVSDKSIDIAEEQIHTKSKGTRTLHTKKISIHDEEGNPQYLLGISEDITERKSLEEATRIQERAFESVADGIVITSTEKDGYRVIHCNPTFEKMTGYTREEIIGKNCNFLQANDFEQEELTKLRKALKEKTTFRGLLRNYKKDGTLFWNELTVSPIKDKSGQVTHFIGIQDDVTEQVKAKETLKDARDELEQRVRERTSDLSKLNDQLRKEVVVRKKAEEELEKNLEQLSRKNRYEEIVSTVTRAVHQSIDVDDVIDNAIHAMHGKIDNLDICAIYIVEGDEAVLKSQWGHSKDFIKRAGRIPYPKGTTWKTILTGKPVYVPDVDKDKAMGDAGRKAGMKSYLGTPIFSVDKAVGVIFMISYVKNAFDTEEIKLLNIIASQIETAISNATQAEALIQSEERYRNLFEQSPVGVYLFDTEMKVTNCNQRMVEMLESSYDDIIGYNIGELNNKNFYETTKKTLEGHYSYQEDFYEATTSSAKLWLSQHFSPLFDSHGNVIGGMGVAEDITERRRTEEELNKHLQLLSKKNRYEEIINAVNKSVHQSIELQTVLDNSIEAMTKNLEKLDIVAIYLIEGEEIVLRGHTGFTEDYIKRAGRIPYPKGVTWKTIINQKPIYVPDVELDDSLGQAGKDMGFNCYLIVPLFIDKEVVGTIAIVSYEKNVFDEEDLKLMDIVSTQISIAIRNAQQAQELIESSEELSKSKEQFRLIVETTDIIPWEAEFSSKKYQYVGPQAQKLLGYPIEKWHEDGFWVSVVHPEDLDEAREKCISATMALENHELEYRMIAKNGEIVWIYETVAVTAKDGKPDHLRGLMINVTERKKSENLLVNEKQILELISQDVELSEILVCICAASEQQSHNMLCSFLLVDETGESLLTAAAPNLPKEYLSATHVVPIGPNIGSCGTASYLKEQVIVSDIENDEKWADFSDLALRNNLRACWSTPILSKEGTLFGTFAMYYPEPRSPNKYELDIIERATHVARIAIERTISEEALAENLDRLSKKSRYEEIIGSVTRSVHSSLELSEVLQKAVDSMHINIDHADNVGIFFVEGDNAVIKANSGYTGELLDKVQAIPKPVGFTWKTILDGQTLYCSDAEKDTVIGPAGKKLGTKSYAGMPIKIRDKTIACISINSLEKDAFDTEELSLLETVAQQIGVAINNASQAEALKKSEENLKENLQRLSKKTRYEEVINAVSQSIHQSLELDEVFNNAVEAISKEIEHAKNVVIYMVEGDINDKDNPAFAVMKANRGHSKEYINKVSRIPYPVGATWKTIIDGKKRYMPDTKEDTAIGPAGLKFGTKSYVSTPLSLDKETVGCIHIHSSQVDGFSEDDLKLLEIVTRQLETAITNASKAEALRKSEEQLKYNLDQLSKKNRYEEIVSIVTRSVHSSIELNEVLKYAAEAIKNNVINADHVAIYFAEGDEAKLKSFTGYPKWFTDKVSTIQKPRGFTWKTLIDGLPRFVPDVSKDKYLGPAGRKAGTKCYASMPIKHNYTTIGCINISSRTVNAFGAGEIKLLEYVATQIQTAINNANHAEALKKSREELRESREHFRLLVETTNVIPWEFDAETLRFTYVGPQAEKLLGYPVADWYKENFWPDHIHEDDLHVVETCAVATAALRDHVIEYRMISNDGEPVWIYEMVSVISEEGKPKTLRGFMIDVTERKLSEDEKREAQERYRALIEHSYEIIVETNINGTLLYINPTFNENLGYKEGALLGRSVFEHIHKDDAPAAIAQFSEAINNFKKGTATYRFKHKSGDWRWLESIASPFLTANGEKRTVISSRDISERMESEKKLQEAFSEIEILKDKLEKENVYLKKEIELNYSHVDIIGQSKTIKSALNKIEQVAETDSTVMLTGETGTGKELFANRIHNLSNRKDRAMVKVNCAALPPHLIESELFGHEKGAFTGAVSKNIGRFEVADGSTIFLDEVAELPLELQSKLLRVLQEGEFQRVGSSKTQKVNVRVITASNNVLLEAVNQGKFREDLFYRLNVFPIEIPALRDRKEDIPDLLWFFISEFEEKMDKTIKNISRKDMENLINYPWPGNVRQLRNIIERSMIISSGPDLQIELPGIKTETPVDMKPIHEVEKDHISFILNMTNWRIRGKSGAAEILGLKPTTLESRIKRLGIKRGH